MTLKLCQNIYSYINDLFYFHSTAENFSKILIFDEKRSFHCREFLHVFPTALPPQKTTKKFPREKSNSRQQIGHGIQQLAAISPLAAIGPVLELQFLQLHFLGARGAEKVGTGLGGDAARLTPRRQRFRYQLLQATLRLLVDTRRVVAVRLRPGELQDAHVLAVLELSDGSVVL